jgi:hypothetical protein
VRYWWVNHKQTFRHEFEGGYIWSPKRKRDGSRNRYYDFLREVIPGDVVFSYAGGAVQGAGFAASYCYTCPRPEEFGDLPSTTRTALIKARVGQGLFKERVGRIERACRITFVDNPAHLIGSHIKPWRECTNEERLEGANGLLLTPSADHLFDRGFISFDDDGELLVSGVADVRSLKRMGADPDSPPRPLAFNRDQRHFLEFHRREVFLGAGS